MNAKSVFRGIVKFLKDEEGLTIVEYAVAGGLITVAVVGAFVTLGSNVNDKITCLGKAVSNGTTPWTGC
jgi:pilus assembly protein Flp/PilA